MLVSDYILLVELGVAIVLNIFAVSVIVRSPFLQSSPNNKYLCCLFVSHVIAALVVSSITITFYECPDHVWRTLVFVREFTTGMELSFTVLLSLERYVAIQKPFVYCRLNVRHGVGATLALVGVVVIFVVWLAVSVTGYAFGLFGTCSGCVFVTYSSYCSYRTIKGHCRRISSMTVSTNAKDKNQHRVTLRKRQVKSLKICSMIAITYLCSWVPLSIYTLVTYWQQTFYGNHFSNDLSNVFIMFGYTNSLMDAFIFFYVSTEARKTIPFCG